MARSTRSTSRLILVALVLLLATGCQARLSVAITVDSDGAGRLELSVGADEELLADARAAGADPLGDVARTGELLAAEGWRTTDVAETDGGRTVTLSAPFDGPEEFNRLAGELTEALAAPELVPLSDVRMEVTEDEIRVLGVAALQPTSAVTELGLQPEQAVSVLRDRDAVVYEVELALPGEVLESTGDRAGDVGPLQWRIEPGERVEILAVGDRPATPWWFLALSGGLGGLGALLLLLTLRSRRSG